jgi:hypothetical protein
MFARIVTTGLILDPETSVREFLFASAGVIPRVEKRQSRYCPTNSVQARWTEQGGMENHGIRTWIQNV